MKAWAINSYGDNSELKLMELKEPEVEDNQVLIKTKAMSLNPVDYKIRDGQLKMVMSFDFPLILGHDCAGEIVKKGQKVRQFNLGDEVFVRSEIGALAELVAVDESYVAPMPKGLTFEEAASVPLVGLTSWQALLERGELKKGDKVFIPAGSGGIGTFAVQLAKHFGAYVASNCSAKNVDFVKSLGASEVYDYKSEDFSAGLSNYDLVYDTMGGETQKKAFSILKKGGKLISLVGPPTPAFVKEEGLGALLYMGSALLSAKTRLQAALRRVHYEFFLMTPTGDTLGKIGELLEKGDIRPVVDKVYSFDKADQAMAYLEKGHARGKVVVTFSGEA